MRGSFLNLTKILIVFLIVYLQQDTRLLIDAIPLIAEENSSEESYVESQQKIVPFYIPHLELPFFTGEDQVITHTGFTLHYYETHEQASWVAYQLTNEKTRRLYERTDRFLPDPKVSTATATDSDYRGSGYDRGHLAPAADMGWSANSMAESFYFSNISPQKPDFNRGIWKKLEELVRIWAIEYDSIYVVTGPVLTEGLKSIGPNQVSVPKYFYKVILDYTEPDVKGIGFILPNEGSALPLQTFAVTIDSVQKITGIDFFHQLPDEHETIIENTLCLSCWTWSSTTRITANDSDKVVSTPVQCAGITSQGARCRNTTKNESGYCNLHTDQFSREPVNSNASLPQPDKLTVQCSAITASGNRCKRMTTNASGKCSQHGGN